MRSRIPFTPLVLVLCAMVPAAAFALPNVIVHDTSLDPFGTTQNGPQIAALGDHVLAVWNEVTGVSPTSQQFQYSHSNDGGSSFVDDGVPPVPAGWRWRIDPRVAIDRVSGRAYLCGQMSMTGRWGVGVVCGSFSAGVVVWDAPVVLVDLPFGGNFTIDGVALCADPVHGRVMVVYSTVPAAPQALFERHSDDGGATWSAAVQVDGPNSYFPGDVEVTASGDGDVLVSWLEFPAATSDRKMRIWAAGDPGFGAASPVLSETLHQFQNPPGASWQGEVGGGFAASQATDFSDGPYRGRTYLAWTDPFQVLDAVFPPITDPGIERYVESEPNDTAYSVSSGLTPGAILRGVAASTVPIDADWYVFKLLAGNRMAIWPDSLPASWHYDLRVVAPDGVQRLTGSTASADGSGKGEKIGFTAPADGFYFLRFSPRTGGILTPVGYRIRTADLPLGPGPAYDQQDVLVTWSDDGVSWSAPVRANSDPFGFHAFQAEVAAGFDGTPYLSWYDYSQSTYGGLSHRVVSRSLDGGVSWGAPVNLTDKMTDWTSVEHLTGTKMGFESSLTADPYGIRAAWTDGRGGDPDAYSTGFATGLTLSGCPSQIVYVHPGEKAIVPMALTNDNPLFSNTVRSQTSTERAWPEPILETPFSPGMTTNFGVSVVVPDTAAAGTMKACARCDIAGASPVTCCFTIAVVSATGVEPAGRTAFGLRVGPNPAFERANLEYSLPQEGHVRLAIYGARGERVRGLADGTMPAGSHRAAWDGLDERGRRAPAGIYFVRLEAQGQVSVVRFARIR